MEFNYWIALGVLVASFFVAIWTLAQIVYCITVFPYLYLMRSKNIIPRGVISKYYFLPFLLWLVIDSAIITVVAIFTVYVIPLAIGFFITLIILISRKQRRSALKETIERLVNAGVLDLNDLQEVYPGLYDTFVERGIIGNSSNADSEETTVDKM